MKIHGKSSRMDRLTAPILILCAVLLCFAVPSTSARSWKPSSKALATDYSQILDDRGDGDVILIWWVVPEIVANYPDAHQILDKYVLIGVAHAHFTADGTATFDSVDRLEADGADGQPLKFLTEDSMPPTVAGVLVAMKSTFRQTLGAMGKGTHWFAFEGGATHACAKGRLSIPFAGQTYTYDTPIPGCPQA